MSAAQYAKLSEQEIRKISVFNGFILSGHSFGGYIAGMYTLAYPQHVKKLLALSPIGYSCSIYNGVEQGEADLEAKYRGLKTHPSWFV